MISPTKLAQVKALRDQLPNNPIPQRDGAPYCDGWWDATSVAVNALDAILNSPEAPADVVERVAREVRDYIALHVDYWESDRTFDEMGDDLSTRICAITGNAGGLPLDKMPPMTICPATSSRDGERAWEQGVEDFRLFLIAALYPSPPQETKGNLR